MTTAVNMTEHSRGAAGVVVGTASADSVTTFDPEALLNAQTGVHQAALAKFDGVGVKRTLDV